jgi:hypothetical protein
MVLCKTSITSRLPSVDWLKFGGGAANNVNGATNSLYFTAGIGDESHGLFGMINVFRGCDDQ